MKLMKCKITIYIFLFSFIQLFSTLTFSYAMFGEYYLYEGKGILKQLEINQYINEPNNWYSYNDYISYEVRNNHIILILCKKQCVTSHDITIKSSRKNVFWKYGPPLRTDNLENGNDLLIYKGITFEVNKQQQVVSILITPILIKK